MSLCLLFCPNDSLAPEITSEFRSLDGSKWNVSPIALREKNINLKSVFRENDIIHFSGHILLNQEDANQTILGCSYSTEGSFHLSELLHMRINQQLVFINGCESAGGAMNKGDGRLSPGLYFLLAGSRGVVEHLWKAPDRSAATLGVEFYRNYTVDFPAKALSESKRNYLSSSQPGLDHPHYWAGIIYSGPIDVDHKSSRKIFFLAISIILLVLSMSLIMRKNKFK